MTTVELINNPTIVTLVNETLVVTLAGVGPRGVPGASGGGVAWSEVTVTSQPLQINSGYVMNNASRVTGTLPAEAPQFSVIRVVGKGAGGWKVAQNAGQTIHFDGDDTTTGSDGYLASQGTFDCIDLLCITADTDFIVTSSIGNITGA